MLKNNIIKNYLKILFETTNLDDELSDLEKKYEFDINQKNNDLKKKIKNEMYSTEGWGLLNNTIEQLEKINKIDYGENLKYKLDDIEDLITTELGFVSIGRGAYRHVYGRKNTPFIIKLEQINSFSKKSLGTNENEYNTYFNYGSTFQPRNDLFTKIYGYDKKDGLWIVFEKVNTFKNSSSDILLKMFKQFFSFLEKIYSFLENEPAFYNVPGYPEDDSNLFQPTNEFEDFINNPKDPQDLFFYFIDFAKAVAWNCYNQSHTDIAEAFKKTLIDFTIQTFTGKASYHYLPHFRKDNPLEYDLLVTKLNENFPDLKPTPDVAYISNFLKNKTIEDLHFGNIGYRDMKNNPTEPWKNLVILDFGEFAF